MVTFALGLLLITLLSRITGSQQATCDENEFSCTDGTCIDSFLVCDGDQNCPDGSDETKSACPKVNIPCPPRAFRCAYGACIDGSKKCNGQKDCADNSDEKPSLCGTPVLTVNASESSCPAGSWVCNNKQCINQYLVCDGDENCRDGSDETEASCINFPCPSLIGFQCAYGGCIDKDRKCDGKKDCKDNSDEDPKICSQTPTGPDYPGTNPIVSGVGCVLPDYPDGGEYKVVTGCEGLDRLSPKCRGVPGTLVDSNTAIVYSCFKRFSLDSNINKSICLNGNWFPGTPSCLRLCKALESKSLVITCTYNGSPVDCTSQGVLPGTKASLKCKQFYQPSGFNYGFPICNHDGSWSESLFSCRPECGITTNNNVTVLVSYGENASSVEYPWHAGLYKFDKDINDIEFFCGGTVIAPYMILTAAHCVYDLRYQPAELHVVVGKTTRSWKVIDTGEQRFTVTKILTHSDYRGNENHYAFDIAVLELNENIVVGRLAMPACIETIPPWTPIEVGTKGTVVGWGKNEFGKLSSQLMVVHLPYLDQATCKRRAGSFRDFITHDKFCATYDSRGAGVQQGDSGGGLVFYKKELNRYFIRGIVSTKPTDRNTFATFTNISEKSHASFLKETRSELRLRHE